MAPTLSRTVAPAAFSGVCSTSAPNRPDLRSGQWVRLEVLPHEWSGYAALLLAQSAPQAWAVWIPDHGEATVCLDALGEVCNGIL